MIRTCLITRPPSDVIRMNFHQPNSHSDETISVHRYQTARIPIIIKIEHQQNRRLKNDVHIGASTRLPLVTRNKKKHTKRKVREQRTKSKKRQRFGDGELRKDNDVPYKRSV